MTGGLERELAFARAKLGDPSGARRAIAHADSLSAIEPRDLWAAPDFTRFRLWAAVAIQEDILTPALARLDPRLRPVRDDPELEAILAR